MKILLVGNYPFDGAKSMHLFADVLERELRQRGLDVRLIAPQPALGRCKPSQTGIGKWLGYIDRYLLFPCKLRAAAAQADVVHLCDHGSAMYCLTLRSKPTVVTCHDMLAVRGALEGLPEMRPSRWGKYLQQWICRGLEQATRVVCISTATLEDASRILGRRDHLRVVLNGLNHPFQPIPALVAEQRLARVPGLVKPFVFHIGSNHPRKNRDGILRVFAKVVAGADLQLVFAGDPLNNKLFGLAGELGVSDRIVQIAKPDVNLLEALYNRAVALIFPSRYEGFGWPPVEAQACGCPVVASDIPPIAQVLGVSAAVHRLDDEAGMAVSILRLRDDANFRERIRQRGFENVRSRFQTSRMIGEYLSLYREMQNPQ